jgi:hypothetical protein
MERSGFQKDNCIEVGCGGGGGCRRENAGVQNESNSFGGLFSKAVGKIKHSVA